MREIFADLHIHSGFSRAVSKDMTLENLEVWAVKKGLGIVGAPDFTHPKWYPELKEKLVPDGSGLSTVIGGSGKTKFLFATEISCIYTQGGQGRRIHVLVLAPDIETVGKLNAQLNLRGNVASDGRPILGISAKELANIAFTVNERCLIIPAHVWTPWFGLYGSKSGFDSLKDCFEDLADRIPAVETGLSSDPPMNWRVSAIDAKTIVSSSDAHSLPNLGREATGFVLQELTYEAIAEALGIPFPDEEKANRITRTIEFHPEEGMYHFDGHRNCNVRWSPEETKKHKGICTTCGRLVTVGVMNRVEELADRPEGYQPKGRPPFVHLVPLREAIGEALDVGKTSKAVVAAYEDLLQKAGNELAVLLDRSLEELKTLTDPRIAEAIKRVREDRLSVTPGYDGTYGIVKIFDEKERIRAPQATLFG